MFNLINTKIKLLKNKVFYKIKNFTRYKAKNYKIALINCYRIKRNCIKEILRKYFNSFYLTTRKLKIAEEISIVEKIKHVFKEMNNNDISLNSFAELDNENMAILIKSIVNRQTNLDNSNNLIPNGDNLILF